MIPSTKEALEIRRCGFQSRAGRVFLIPRLPEELVYFTELHYLSDRVDPFWYPADWKPKRSAIRPIPQPMDPLSKEEQRIIRLLQNAPEGRLRRHDLQCRLSRRISTRYLDHMLDQLTAADHMCSVDGWVYPYSRAKLELIRRRERERRLTPIYAIYLDGSKVWYQNP